MSATTFSYYLAWLRLRTGSVWPCIVAHAAWNSITQVAFDTATSGSAAGLWVGGSGLLVALIGVIVVVGIYKIWPLRELKRTPNELFVNDDLGQGGREEAAASA